MISYVTSIVNTLVFPHHLGNTNCTKKVVFLGYFSFLCLLSVRIEPAVGRGRIGLKLSAITRASEKS